jgi:hypothetical protein
VISRERSGDRRLRRAVGEQLDAWEPMQADKLDQVHDLGLGALQQQPALTPAQTVRKHRQIDHQRGIREHEITQIDDHITLRAEGKHERPSP